MSQPFGSEIGNIFGNFIKMVKIRPSWAMAVCHLELYFFFTSPYIIIIIIITVYISTEGEITLQSANSEHRLSIGPA